MALILVEHTNNMEKFAFNGLTLAYSNEIGAQQLNSSNLTLQKNLSTTSAYS